MVHKAAREQPGLFQLIAEDYNSNGRDWTKPGFRVLFAHRFGVWRMGIRSRLLRAPLSVLYRMMYRYVRNVYGIEIWYTVKIGRRVKIAHQHGITVHPFATIGDDCIIRQGVTLGAAATYAEDQAPVLGNNVNVGAGAMLLGKITVGDNARIGPNAVVMTNVPANATAAAPPARIIQLPTPKPPVKADQAAGSGESPPDAGRRESREAPAVVR